MDLLDGVTEEDLAALLRAATPGSFDPSRLAASSFWESVRREVHAFLCTSSPGYADLRREWDALKRDSTAVAVGALTAAVSVQLGSAAAVVAPLVIWALTLALRVGTRAYCNMSLI